LLPGDAVVRRPENTALAIGGLDVGIEDVGLHGRNGESDAPELFVGQAGGDFLPGLAAVGAAMDRALGPAVDEGGKRSAALIRRRDDDVGVARVEDDVADTGVLGDLQHLVPGLAAVGRLVEAAIAAGRPERSLCGDVHRIAILRIDDDAPDVFGGFQADVGPRSAAVLALV